MSTLQCVRLMAEFKTGLTYMYFCRGVACEYFGSYGTRSRVVHVGGFWGGLKFEANVRRQNPSATDPDREYVHRSIQSVIAGLEVGRVTTHGAPVEREFQNLTADEKSTNAGTSPLWSWGIGVGICAPWCCGFLTPADLQWGLR